MGKISKNELNTSLATKIEEIDLKANISDLETTNTQLAQKVNKAGDTMTGNLNVPTINSKTPAYAITPTETVITSGFTVGWSGEIRIRKNQEGQKTMTWLLTRNADIVASEGVFVLSEEYRPLFNAHQHVIGRVASTGSFVPNSLIGVDVVASTGIIVFSNAGVSTNVRMVVGTMSFY